MPAVWPEMFKGRESCSGDVDWKIWMQMAEERYKAFAHVQNTEDTAQVREDDSLTYQEVVETNKEGDNCSLDSFIESDSEASQDYPEEDMELVKSLVGSYAGPLTDADKAAQKKADAAERSTSKTRKDNKNADCSGNQIGAGVGSDCKVTDACIRFECLMLQRLER